MLKIFVLCSQVNMLCTCGTTENHGKTAGDLSLFGKLAAKNDINSQIDFSGT